MKNPHLAKYGFLACIIGLSIITLMTLYEIDQINLTNLTDHEKNLAIAARVLLSAGAFAMVILSAYFAYIGKSAVAKICVWIAVCCELFAAFAGGVGRFAVSQNSHQQQQAVDITADTLKNSASAKFEASKLSADAAKKYGACAGKRDGCTSAVAVNANRALSGANEAKADGLAAAAALSARGVTQIDSLERVFPGNGVLASNAFDASVFVLLGLISSVCMVAVGQAAYVSLRGAGEHQAGDAGDVGQAHYTPSPTPNFGQGGRMLFEDFEPAKSAQTTHQDQTKVEPKSVNPPVETGLKVVRGRSKSDVKPDQKKLTKTQAIAAIKRGEQSPDLGKLKVAVVGGQPVAETIRRELVATGVLVAIDKRGKLGLAS